MTIDSAQDERFMRIALEQAALAPALGEVPIGALLVHDGQILARAHNLRETRQDPTAHAEIVVIQEAASTLGTWRLIDCILYVTLEPCPMCAGAIVQSRIARTVFGAWDPKAGACGSLMDILTDTRLNHRVAVTGGLCESDSQVLLRDFFRQRRRETP
ncbi:MAG: tRNA-specific adenosine deaminase [Nitrospira sp.]|nr:MAG: tRNA-specific adenosine deaminase [Nitrospira sp.]